MTPVNQETEVKFCVRDMAALSQRILAVGGKVRKPRVHELNLRFDTVGGELMRTRRVLRLRRDYEARLTYKDAGIASDGIRMRREIELAVSDFESARGLLFALGYTVVFTYEKFRTTFITGDVELMLDELPIGYFIEIEGPTESLRPLASQLGLDWHAAITNSYQGLFETVRIARHLPFSDLTFDNFTGIIIDPKDLGVHTADD